MKAKPTSAWMALLVSSLLIGCSKQEPAAPSGTEQTPAADVADEKMTRDTDVLAEEILQSENQSTAGEWLQRYPKSAFGEDEDGNPVPLSKVVAQLSEAGAERIVIESGKLGGGEFLLSMVVVLPSDPAMRKKIFALEPALSEMCQQTPVSDKGQKYLYYSFD